LLGSCCIQPSIPIPGLLLGSNEEVNSTSSPAQHERSGDSSSTGSSELLANVFEKLTILKYQDAIVNNYYPITLKPLGELPPNHNTRILDSRCGTGAWATEIARLYPDSNVLGLDCMRMQPTPVSRNVEFQPHDINSPWKFPLLFHYVHTFDDLFSGLHWESYVDKVWNNLENGGVAEFVNLSFVFDDDACKPFYRHWAALVRKAVPFNLDIWKELPSMLKNARFSIELNEDRHLFFGLLETSTGSDLDLAVWFHAKLDELHSTLVSPQLTQQKSDELLGNIRKEITGCKGGFVKLYVIQAMKII
jgi:hypothetical protein